MTASKDNTVQTGDTTNFDLVRLSKSKQCVDLAPNTIRNFAEQGLRLYRSGKMVFFSRNELEQFIKARAT